MSEIFKKQVPGIIVFVLALLVISDYFVPATRPIVGVASSWFLKTGTIIGNFAMIFGATSLFIHHIRRMFSKKDVWYGEPFNSFILLAIIVAGVVFGTIWGQSSKSYMFIFSNMNVVGTTVLNSMHIFFFCSTAYRAFRVKNIESAALFLTFVITTLGAITLGVALIPPVSPLTTWIGDFPSKAGSVGIVMAAALGELLLGVRTMLGKERGALMGAE
ncbi:MAG: hypothetical protein HWN66_11720 [Candidatus Helarchaeota archaeon]|nr:hypothetical protein [Candidatus Helarchaeota archaeon]